jgi:hypothetical protein
MSTIPGDTNYNAPNVDNIQGDNHRPSYDYNDFNMNNSIVQDELQRQLNVAKTFMQNRGAVTPASLAASLGLMANNAMSDAHAKIAAASVSNDPGALMEAQLATSNATQRSQQGTSITAELGSTYKNGSNYKN